MALALVWPGKPAQAGVPMDLTAQVSQTINSVVGIMRFDPKSSLPGQLIGTGFAVIDGRHIITNAHVVREPPSKAPKKITYFAVLPVDVGAPKRVRLTMLDREDRYDLALLQIAGSEKALPALKLINSPKPVSRGSPVFSIGFPIARALGPFPAVSSGIVSAITPSLSPQLRASQLDAAFIRSARFSLYQLDMTAYPGQSGSPLLHASTGQVIGVVNSTKLKSDKEKVLSDPSGISYAIMAAELRTFLLRNGLQP